MRLALAALTASLLLAGCQRPPPVLDLAGGTCDAAPVLANAVPVPFGEARGARVTLAAGAPCLDQAEGRAIYAVFALPASSAPYRITVRSLVGGAGMIWPDATILTANGHSRARMTDFRAAASSIVATTRGEPADRYVLVRSSPATVGMTPNIPTAANPPPIRLAAAVFIPIFIPPPGPLGPTTSKIQATLAHSGTITVSAMPYLTVP